MGDLLAVWSCCVSDWPWLLSLPTWDASKTASWENPCLCSAFSLDFAALWSCVRKHSKCFFYLHILRSIISQFPVHRSEWRLKSKCRIWSLLARRAGKGETLMPKTASLLLRCSNASWIVHGGMGRARLYTSVWRKEPGKPPGLPGNSDGKTQTCWVMPRALLGCSPPPALSSWKKETFDPLQALWKKVV